MPTPIALVKVTEAILRSCPEYAFMVSGHGPNGVVRETFGVRIRFPTTVAQPTYQPAAGQSYPQRALPILQRRLASIGWQTVGLSDYLPARGRAVSQPHASWSVKLVLSIEIKPSDVQSTRQPGVPRYKLVAARG